MELYRIQSRFNESMWYSFKGKYTNRFEELTGQFVPMPFEEFRQLEKSIKLLSSVEDIEMFPNWFSKKQIDLLFNSGYSLFKYDVNSGIHLPKGEVLFDFNKVNSMEEIQNDILRIYNDIK